MKRKIAIALNIFIAVMTLVAWMQMTFSSGSADLSASSLENLKFFTVLSNIFSGIVAIVYLVLVAKKKAIGQQMTILKLVSASAVGLTFATVMIFLGPLYGYPSMFAGANLWLHLFLPVAAMVSFMFFEEGSFVPLKQTAWAMVPPALYSVGYLTNIAINGVGTWPNSNDFYGFLLWGYGVGAVIVCVILLGTWGISLILRRAANSRR